MKNFFVVLISMLLVFGAFVCSSVALPIYGNSTTGSTEGIGSFVGELIYEANEDDTSATLTVELTNTSPGSNGGFITAFAFNSPSNNITDVSLSSTDNDFSLIGGPSFSNSIKVSPFGKFDIGASISDAWLGEKKLRRGRRLSPGGPSRGIGIGATETFTFNLKGINLSSLDERSFWEVLSLGSKQSQPFAMRFRGFKDGGSDKVSAVSPDLVIPEPTTILLLGMGLVSFLVFTRKHRKR